MRPAERRALRAHEVANARQHDSYSYRFAWDGDQLVEIRAWPDGRSTVTQVDRSGKPTAPPRSLGRTGLLIPRLWDIAPSVPLIALTAFVVERLI